METAFEALARVGFKLKFSFGVDSVNKVFKGGLNPGEIYEIIGESGMGKTQLLMAIANEYLLSQSRFGVCWIDSNGSFRSRRFLEFDSEKRIDILDRLFVASVHEPRELIRKLHMIEKDFDKLGIRLLIIDNIGSLLNRTAWTLKTGGSDCQKGVMSLLSNLVNKRLTVVLSNHLINMDGEERPSLGRLWGKLINRRIVINRDDRGLHVKPWNTQNSKIGYLRIAERGLVEIDSSSTDTLSRRLCAGAALILSIDSENHGDNHGKWLMNASYESMSAGDSEQDIHPVENINGGACSRRVKKRYISSGSRPTIQAKHNQMYLITTLSSSQEAALINKLPKECLLHIFSFLGVKDLCRSAQVCRLWNQLALDGSNWQRVDLFTFQRDVKSSVIENLARRCGGFLKQLSLKGCENVQDSSLRAFTARCKNIEHLSLYKCRRVTDATCENLGKHCHRLLHLNLENCTAITDRACKYISEGCPNLRYLNLSWCDNITDRGIHSILTGCKNMNTLILRGCEGLTERCFEDMEQHMGNILRLNMLSCFVTDDTVAHIASGSPKIEYLCLSQCTQITDRSLISLANNCKFLKAVEFTGCNLLSDVGFLQLGRHCKQLQKMDLEDCTLLSDASITCISTNCPNMADLILSHCEQITDDAIHQLCTNNKEKLRILELDNCPLISDTALSYLRNVKNLKRIDLYDCPNVSRDAINLFKAHRPTVEIQAYFAPATPPVNHQHPRAGAYCIIQ